MRAEAENTVAAIEKSLDLLARRMDWDTAGHRLEEFNAMAEDPNLWNDPGRAQTLMRERQMLVDAMERLTSMRRELSDNVELIALGEQENDSEVLEDARAALMSLAERAAQAEVEALLDGEADGNDTYLEINAGAGGTESCDWVKMLARMYERWAEAHGYEVQVQSLQPGEEAGLKSVCFKIAG
ncbi:MAG: PCRF domain-containing protein, partial [Boseongicola sp. SB0662_bin_57]|nr:PCRF domain-containing protein [Boseongicola sp. SB0662_bin_57]